MAIHLSIMNPNEWQNRHLLEPPDSDVASESSDSTVPDVVAEPAAPVPEPAAPREYGGWEGNLGRPNQRGVERKT